VTNLLTVNNLTIRFITQEGVVHAVENVSLSVAEGETVMIVGKNSCGKSHSMLSIVGLNESFSMIME